MTIWRQSQRDPETEYVTEWKSYQKTLRQQYRNRGQILTNERQTQNILNIKNIAEWSAEPFWTHIFTPRNDCQ